MRTISVSIPRLRPALACGLALWAANGWGQGLIDYVDMRMGESRDGHTGDYKMNCNYGPQMPWGAIQPGPESQPIPETVGFGLRDSIINGITQTHASGTGVGLYGNLRLFPFAGAYDGHWSNQVSHADYYTVTLGKVKLELTPSHNCAFYRFTFPASDSAGVAMELATNMSRTGWANAAVTSPVLGGSASQRVLRGKGTYDIYWGGRITMYFVLHFDKAPASIDSAGTLGRYRFKTAANEVVDVKLGFSEVSWDMAEKHLAEELPDWDFEAARGRCAATWNAYLSPIQIEGATDAQKKLFYSCLYRTMMMPHDRTSDNPWGTGKPYMDDHMADWDTWRTLYPLMSLIHPDFVRDNVNFYIDRFAKTGKVKDVFVAGTDGGEQGGNDPENILVEAYLKQIPGVDWAAAYKTLVGMARNSRDRKAGASTLIEYAYNDFLVALMAKLRGDQPTYQAYADSSTLWNGVWNGHGFCGSCYEICPGYDFFVPHDLAGLIAKYGGQAAFLTAAQAAVAKSSVSNEPDFLLHRVFHYAARPDLTSQYVHTIIPKFNINPLNDQNWSTYPGDEDSGAMSSWFVFSALGLFPNAGQDIYLLNAPLYPKSTLKLGNGATLVIEAPGAGDGKNIYIKSATFNGKPFDRAWIRHGELLAGGTLHFELSTTASSWGTTDLPPSRWAIADSLYPVNAHAPATGRQAQSPVLAASTARGLVLRNTDGAWSYTFSLSDVGGRMARRGILAPGATTVISGLGWGPGLWLLRTQGADGEQVRIIHTLTLASP